MIPYKIVKRFSEENNCRLNFVENGQHWLHIKRIQKHAFRLQIPSKKKNYRNQIKASSKVPVGKIYENPFDDDYLLELME